MTDDKCPEFLHLSDEPDTSGIYQVTKNHDHIHPSERARAKTAWYMAKAMENAAIDPPPSRR